MMKRFDKYLPRRARSFGKDEEGSMIVFTLFLLVIMLVVSGMAVDFMRFEAKRSAMQGCIDNAVLAAADLDKTGTKEELEAVAADWFKAGDCIGVLQGTGPNVELGTNQREVSARANLDVDTFFLRLIGMDTLTAGATATANEGIGDIEVSLVLDISGSMREVIKDAAGNEVDFDEDTSGTQSRTRIEALRIGAKDFVDTLLADEFKDKISISFIPYSGHVNVGEELFAALSTTQRHSFSHCVDFPDDELTKTVFNDSITLPQVEHFQSNSASAYDDNGNFLGPLIDQPLCPRNDYEQIIPISNNKSQLNTAISQLQPRSATAIYMGLKWGVSLLDPSINTLLGTLPTGTIPDEFTNRPVDYAANTGSGSTLKYLVLMTDGQNDPHPRMNPNLVMEPSQIAYWDTAHWWWFEEQLCNVSWTCYNNGRTAGPYVFEDDETVYNTNMQTLCTNARNAGIIIYGIAMGGNATGEAQISQCVDSPARFFKTSGDSLATIFQAIADQITELRLTQ